MGFSPHRTEIHEFKIPPTAFSEQTAKYNVRQYICLYGIYLYIVQLDTLLHYLLMVPSNRPIIITMALVYL